MNPTEFRTLPIVQDALKSPHLPRSILNYMCACDTSDPKVRKGLNTDDIVSPLLNIWFVSGTELDDLCQPFAVTVRALKADPPILTGDDWDSLEQNRF